MATTVTAIYRYPVKGLSAEKMDRVALMPGECLPHDRRFAIALGSTLFDPQHPEWLSKTHFIMLMRDEKLAQLQTRFNAESGVLVISETGRVLLSARMTEPEGCRLVADFFANFLGTAMNGPLRVDYPLRFSVGLQQQSFFSYTGTGSTSSFRPVVRISIF